MNITYFNYWQASNPTTGETLTGLTKEEAKECGYPVVVGPFIGQCPIDELPEKFKSKPDIKMNVNDVKANGISWSSPANNIRPILEVAISVYRIRFTDEEIFSKFPKGDDYYPGSRYSDNGSVATRITSAIVSAAKEELLKQSIFDETTDLQEIQLEQFIDVWFNSLSAKEVDVLIQDGMRDCASADHWYRFEKQWD